MDTPIHLAHVSCHDRFNREIDNPQWDIEEYILVMIQIDFGNGIYAPELVASHIGFADAA